MTLFNNWLSRKPREKSDADQQDALQGEERVDGLEIGPETEKASNRKMQRMQRRETLYAIIRENMIRMGALSTAYRFRVLSMDAGGKQYVVMMDLAEDLAAQTTKLQEFEKTVQRIAGERHGLTVTSVYWRISDELTRVLPKSAEPVDDKKEQAAKMRQDMMRLMDEADRKMEKASGKNSDFQATTMLDPKGSEGPVSDFAATQMIDFSQDPKKKK